MKKHDDSLDQEQLVDEATSSEETQTDSSTDSADLGQSDVELEELKQQLAVTQDQLKRALADYHNLEKRINEGRAEMAGWASAELVRRVLPTLDHLEMTVKGAGDNDRQSGWFKGVEMSVKQLQQVLQDEGLVEIKVEGNFDPMLHEAVDTREPTDAEAKAGKGENDQVLEVVEKGYNLKGKVLRPAKVVVGRKG